VGQNLGGESVPQEVVAKLQHDIDLGFRGVGMEDITRGGRGEKSEMSVKSGGMEQRLTSILLALSGGTKKIANLSSTAV